MRRWWGPVNLGLVIGAVLLLVALAGFDGHGLWGWDARAYRVNISAPYGIAWGGADSFVYSPAFAQVVGIPASMVPLEWFLLGWTIASAGVLAYVGGRHAAIFLFLPPVLFELNAGNIHLLLALMVVVGFRWPAAWAFALLTKVTPGVGLLWFVARRDWRSLWIALGTTATLAGISFVVAPDLWRQWLDLLVGQASQPGLERANVLPLGPLWLRLTGASLIAFAAGLAGYRWPVMVAVLLAMPVVWFNGLSMLVGLVALAAMDRRYPLPAMVTLARTRPVTS